MNILIVPDSFKGSLSSAETGACIQKGFQAVFPHAQYTVLSMADGGEGTTRALLEGAGGKLFHKTVTGPMGKPVKASYAILDDGTAVIEMAAASGLDLTVDAERNPAYATTYGTGELMRAAIARGAKKLFIGIGGSATNDGGVGMAKALGAKFYDRNGEELSPGVLSLLELDRIDCSGLDPRLRDLHVTVACDVKNPLCGPNGASYVFGPQKGAGPELIRKLDQALSVYSKKLAETFHQDFASVPGAGAAGGMGAGLMAFCGGRLIPGIDEIMSILRLEERVREADLVITGEGRIDKTSVMGKVLSGIGRLGKACGTPVVAVGGSIGEGAEAVYDAGISAFLSSVNKPMEITEAIEHAPVLLQRAAQNMARFLKTGMELAT